VAQWLHALARNIRATATDTGPETRVICDKFS